MEHIGGSLEKIEQNMRLNTADPVARDGFTQLPNFILRNPNISIGAKTTYALFLSYAWHNSLCCPGNLERLFFRPRGSDFEVCEGHVRVSLLAVSDHTRICTRKMG